ncbi:MAG TPA: flavodoxin-dependent (E)-4-hydroxy-3-methylbut-2-enyl-diphosphate synthase, partial [Tenuifilaceae bacterium]|nr:flavodoxin-dependent (E)-4-hydroxy-3-methylbut-2-enyl-diphosphate synthase [Tenuifilaceae bacterium]
NRKSNPAIEDIKELPYNPFEYNRRETISAGNIGANNPPIVIANISNQTIFNEKTLNNWGWFLNTQSNRWERKDVAADYFFVGDTQIETSINAEQLPIIQSSSIISIESLKQGVNKNYQLIKLDYSDLNNTANIELLKKINATIILSTNNSNGFAEQRAAFIKLIENGIKLPVIVHREYSDDDKENLQLKSASDFGALLIDGLGDGVMLTAPKISDSDICSTAFTILQAARTRISKTEYISCPGCGRTLFNLQQTLQKVKSTTAQLKGLKIGVMGCIVNGPGEMADADYGYVGAGPGRITLYKGKEVVKKNIPEENAIEELINVIKENGDWKE